MDPARLLEDPALRAWALACIVLALKMLVTGIVVSRTRIRKNVFASPEDYAMQGVEPKTEPDPEVERARRVHQNDLEANLPFALLGLVYALTGPTTLGLWVCFAGFPLARILHMITYLQGRMPHRTITWAAGFFILVWMAGASLVSILF